MHSDQEFDERISNYNFKPPKPSFVRENNCSVPFHLIIQTKNVEDNNPRSPSSLAPTPVKQENPSQNNQSLKNSQNFENFDNFENSQNFEDDGDFGNGGDVGEYEEQKEEQKEFSPGKVGCYCRYY